MLDEPSRVDGPLPYQAFRPSEGCGSHHPSVRLAKGAAGVNLARDSIIGTYIRKVGQRRAQKNQRAEQEVDFQ